MHQIIDNPGKNKAKGNTTEEPEDVKTSAETFVTGGAPKEPEDSAKEEPEDAKTSAEITEMGISPPEKPDDVKTSAETTPEKPEEVNASAETTVEQPEDLKSSAETFVTGLNPEEPEDSITQEPESAKTSADTTAMGTPKEPEGVKTSAETTEEPEGVTTEEPEGVTTSAERIVMGVQIPAPFGSDGSLKFYDVLTRAQTEALHAAGEYFMCLEDEGVKQE